MGYLFPRSSCQLYLLSDCQYTPPYIYSYCTLPSFTLHKYCATSPRVHSASLRVRGDLRAQAGGDSCIEARRRSRQGERAAPPGRGVGGGVLSWHPHLLVLWLSDRLRRRQQYLFGPCLSS